MYWNIKPHTHWPIRNHTDCIVDRLPWVRYTGMYMFDLNRWYNRRYNWGNTWLIVALIHIKHVHSSVSYQWATYQKYNRCGHESPFFNFFYLFFY